MIKRVIAALLAILAAVALGLFAVGWMLSHPVQARIGDPPEELKARSVAFASQSGTTIHGWWSRAPGREVVLLLPGVRANRLSMVDRARFLHQAGYSVLLIDLQATGESVGPEITFGWRESRDVLAAASFIQREVPDARTAVIGSSLGGAAALIATPPLHVQAYVLEAVYPTIRRAANNRLRNYLGPIGELGTPLLLLQLRLRLGASAQELRPVDHIHRISAPVFVINGLDDQRTTRQDALLLYSRARSPKQLWLVPRAGHVDIHRAATAEYESRVLSFLAFALRERPMFTHTGP